MAPCMQLLMPEDYTGSTGNNNEKFKVPATPLHEPSLLPSLAVDINEILSWPTKKALQQSALFKHLLMLSKATSVAFVFYGAAVEFQLNIVVSLTCTVVACWALCTCHS